MGFDMDAGASFLTGLIGGISQHKEQERQRDRELEDREHHIRLSTLQNLINDPTLHPAARSQYVRDLFGLLNVAGKGKQGKQAKEQILASIDSLLTSGVKMPDRYVESGEFDAGGGSVPFQPDPSHTFAPLSPVPLGGQPAATEQTAVPLGGDQPTPTPSSAVPLGGRVPPPVRGSLDTSALPPVPGMEENPIDAQGFAGLIDLPPAALTKLQPGGRRSAFLSPEEVNAQDLNKRRGVLSLEDEFDKTRQEREAKSKRDEIRLRGDVELEKLKTRLSGQLGNMQEKERLFVQRKIRERIASIGPYMRATNPGITDEALQIEASRQISSEIETDGFKKEMEAALKEEQVKTEPVRREGIAAGIYDKSSKEQERYFTRQRAMVVRFDKLRGEAEELDRVARAIEGSKNPKVRDQAAAVKAKAMAKWSEARAAASLAKTEFPDTLEVGGMSALEYPYIKPLPRPSRQPASPSVPSRTGRGNRSPRYVPPRPGTADRLRYLIPPKQ